MKGNNKPDILWILIDGIRPDKLRSCGNSNRPFLFIDEVLLKGTFFTKVISPGANTKISVYAAFTSLYPFTNKMDAYDYKLIKKCDPFAVTITDILRYHGYKTFCYQDVVIWKSIPYVEHYVPTSGFHVWESSGYKDIGETPRHSFSTKKRNAFITNLNKSSSPKFAYIHLLSSHDLNNEFFRRNPHGRFSQTSESYENVLIEVSEDFKDVWDKLQINNETLIIISTDHGARLDFPDIFLEEQRYGVRLRDISMNTFCSLINPSFPKQVINKMVRTIDIVPTILDIAGCIPIRGQGISLLPLVRGEDFPQIHAFMEAGGIFEKPPSYDKSNVWGVRTDNWKYWKHVSRGEWLIDLENDPNEEVNLIGKGLIVEEKLRKLVKEELLDNTKTVEQIYEENAIIEGNSTYFTKKQILPEVSLFLLVKEKNSHVNESIDSILAQISIYIEITIVDFTYDGSMKTVFEGYQDYRIRYIHSPSNSQLNLIFNEARGDYFAFLSSEIVYSPIFLFELRNKLEINSKIDLLYADYQNIYQKGFKKTVNVKNRFNKKKTIGYCFLARKEIVRKFPNLINTILTSNNSFLLLPNNISLCHVPLVLGSRKNRVGMFTLSTHIISDKIIKLVKSIREEGWQGTVNKGRMYLKTKIRKIVKLGRKKGYYVALRSTIIFVGKKTAIYWNFKQEKNVRY